MGIKVSRNAFLLQAGIFLVATPALGQAEVEKPNESRIRTTASSDPKELFRRVSPSVLVVEALGEDGSVVALGSGVAIGQDQVVTNTHVVDPGSSIRVRQGKKVWTAEIEQINLRSDLCRLRIKGLGTPTVLLRPFEDLQVGERVYAIGAPAGMELTISEGLISGLRNLDREKIVQTTAAISAGSSGGGLFDGQGQLVGITTFYFRGGQNLNFAIPTDSVREATSFRESLRSRKAATRTVPEPQTSSSFEDFLGSTQELREAKEKVEAGPDDWMAHLLLGHALRRRGDTHQAVLEMTKAVELKSDAAEARLGLGMTLGRIGDWHGAVSELETATQLNPDDFVTCFELAMALDKDDRPEDAMAQSLRCADSKLFAPLAVELALSMSEAGDAEYAETVCHAAILGDARKPYGLECLGRVFVDSNRYKNATVAFKAALRLAPENPDLHHYLAEALDAMGEKEQAREEYQRAVELNPASPTFKADYERARRALNDRPLTKDKDGKRPN